MSVKPTSSVDSSKTTIPVPSTTVGMHQRIVKLYKPWMPQYTAPYKLQIEALPIFPQKAEIFRQLNIIQNALIKTVIDSNKTLYRGIEEANSQLSKAIDQFSITPIDKPVFKEIKDANHVQIMKLYETTMEALRLLKKQTSMPGLAKEAQEIEHRLDHVLSSVNANLLSKFEKGYAFTKSIVNVLVSGIPRLVVVTRRVKKTPYF